MTVTVLIADDHQMLRDGLRRVVTDAGIIVVGEASDGSEAVELARELKPDVVLMDVSMPVLDGIEATQRLKDISCPSRVLILTMHADPSVLRRALDAGASGYLVKDSSSADVVRAIRLVADGNRALSPELAEALLAELATGSQAERLLTHRETEVLQHIAAGLSTSEVGERLYISSKTVKNHLASIYQKMDARDRTQAVVQGVRLGIIKLD